METFHRFTLSLCRSRDEALNLAAQLRADPTLNADPSIGDARVVVAESWIDGEGTSWEVQAIVSRMQYPHREQAEQAVFYGLIRLIKGTFR